MSSSREIEPNSWLTLLPRRIRSLGNLLQLSHYAASPSTLLPGNNLQILSDGRETFPRMLDAIDRARRYVHLETYIWQADTVGRRFADHLRKKARSGVRVRVIYDGLGSVGLPFDFVESLKDDRIEIVEFRPLLSRSAWPPTSKLGRRDHRKILVIDGQSSFCGGINLSDEYAPREQGGLGWRDTHLEIRGPLTAQLDRLFWETWSSSGGRPYQRYPAVGLDSVAVDAVMAAALPSNESGQRGTIRRHYLHAISKATSRIFIANAYFVPNRSFLRSLCAAADRGVDVRLLLPSLEHNDVLVAQLASQSCWSALLAAGVRLFRWPDAHMHSKSAVIDGLWSIVGSYNLDAISLFQNLEVVIEILGREFGERLESIFDRDFQIAEELDVDSWRRERGVLTKAAETALYRFRRFL